MAMVMMLILVPVLMFLAMSFVDPIVRSFRSAVNDQKTLLAKNVAQNALEVALWESRGMGIGENKCNEGYPTPITKEYDFGNATVRWCVMGAPEVDDKEKVMEVIPGDKYYTIPSPGSGTAGDDYCSTNEPVVNDDKLDAALITLGIEKQDLGSLYTAFDWPCNWNKLHEGESITIPLYTEDSEGTVLNPSDLGLTEFELAIRTPCNPDAFSRDDEYRNSICDVTSASGERYVLEGDNPGDGVNTVIVLWQITGKQGDEDGDDVVIEQLDMNKLFLDSKFTVKVINGNGDFFTALKNSSVGKKNDNSNPQIGQELQNLYKPVLRIIPVHTLKNTSDETIPYLEYQFKAKLNSSLDKPVSNTSKVVHVEVMIDGGYSETIEKTVGIAKSVSGFVIQQ